MIISKHVNWRLISLLSYCFPPFFLLLATQLIRRIELARAYCYFPLQMTRIYLLCKIAMNKLICSFKPKSLTDLYFLRKRCRKSFLCFAHHSKPLWASSNFEVRNSILLQYWLVVDGTGVEESTIVQCTCYFNKVRANSCTSCKNPFNCASLSLCR